MKEGDKNSKFFHASILIRRQKNSVLAIKDGDRWLHERAQIGDYFIKKFQDLYNSSPYIELTGIEELLDKQVGQEENEALLRVPEEDEIKATILGLHALKSLGPDGYLGIFYRRYWSIVKEQVVKVVHEVFKTQNVTKGLNRMFIVLIPKRK